MPPPPVRPLSAPQNSGPSNFGPAPLQAQHTGAVGYMNSGSPPPNVNQMQQMGQLQPQFTSFNPQGQGYPQQQQQFSPNHMQPQMTSFNPQQQQFGMNGQAGSSFGNSSLQPQQTGYLPPGMNFQSSPPSGQGMMPQPTGSVNSMLPPALHPQSTGAVNGFGRPAFGQPPPPMPSIPSQYQSHQQQSSLPPPPPIPQQTTAAPLQPQKTGPAPNIKFGIQADAKKLMAQPTGRKANLAQASKFRESSGYHDANVRRQRPKIHLASSRDKVLWLVEHLVLSFGLRITPLHRPELVLA
jgi:actin cytoskeleton-regulatory complex protein SLA1